MRDPRWSTQIRGLIVDMLWRGLYAEDQVERFLPMLCLRNEALRQRAWNAMPEYLKRNIAFDPACLPTPDEFTALATQIKGNAARAGKLIKVINAGASGHPGRNR